MFESSVVTPFGKIRLSFIAGSSATAPAAPSTLLSGSGTQLFSWSCPELRAELFIVSLQPELPPGMVVTDCRAAFWRIRAHADFDECVFEARWAPEAHLPQGGPTSGQALNALTWQNESTALSLGTPDAEGLLNYQRAGLALPAAWLALVGGGDPSQVNIEDYLPDGLRLRLPGLRAHEIGHIHFAVAWANAEEQDDAPWFAVDLGAVVIRSCLDRMTNERAS